MNPPSQTLLTEILGQPCQLETPWGDSVMAELVLVSDGVALNKHYCCYAAEFALPAGESLPQAVYTVGAAGGRWPLLLTPIGPGADGRALLEAVFHYLIPQVQAEPAGA